MKKYLLILLVVFYFNPPAFSMTSQERVQDAIQFFVDLGVRRARANQAICESHPKYLYKARMAYEALDGQLEAEMHQARESDKIEEHIEIVEERLFVRDKMGRALSVSALILLGEIKCSIKKKKSLLSKF